MIAIDGQDDGGLVFLDHAVDARFAVAAEDVVPQSLTSVWVRLIIQGLVRRRKLQPYRRLSTIMMVLLGFCCANSSVRPSREDERFATPSKGCSVIWNTRVSRFVRKLKYI